MPEEEKKDSAGTGAEKAEAHGNDPVHEEKADADIEELRKKIEGDVKLDIIRKLVENPDKKPENPPEDIGPKDDADDAGAEEAGETKKEESPAAEKKENNLFKEYKVPIYIFAGVFAFFMIVLAGKMGLDSMTGAAVADNPEEPVENASGKVGVSEDTEQPKTGNKELYNRKFKEESSKHEDSIETGTDLRKSIPKENDEEGAVSNVSGEHNGHGDDEGFNISMQKIFEDVNITGWIIHKLRSELNITVDEENQDGR